MNYYNMLQTANNDPAFIAAKAAMNAQIAEIEAEQTKLVIDFAKAGQDRLTEFRALAAAQAAARMSMVMIEQEVVQRSAMNQLLSELDNQSVDLVQAMSRL